MTKFSIREVEALRTTVALYGGSPICCPPLCDGN